MYPIHLKFAVFGSSGAGKTKLIELVRQLAPNITVHKKDTTRQVRLNEDPEKSIDLRFIPREEFETNREDYDVIYTKYGELYGVRRDQFLKAFDKKEIHFAVIRDIPTIQQLKFMYPDFKAIYVHVDPERIPDRIKARDTLRPEERKERTIKEYTEFLENNTLFDHTILNFWDASNAVKQLRNILNYYVRQASSNL